MVYFVDNEYYNRFTVQSKVVNFWVSRGLSSVRSSGGLLGVRVNGARG